MGFFGGSATERRRRSWPAAVLCGLLAAAVFAPTASFEFVNWDDDLHVYRNPQVTGGGVGGISDALLTPRLGYPIPVTVASYRLDHALWALDATGYHVTNVVVHGAATALVFVLCVCLGLRRPAAMVAAVVFALHPAVAEPVSWVSGRKDLLATALALASIIAHLRWPFSPAKPRSYLGATLFALAALAKPSVLLIPAFAAVAHRRASGTSWKRAGLAVLPMVVISAAVLLLATVGQAHVGALAASESIAAWARNIWYALGHQVSLLLLIQEPLPKHIVPSPAPLWSIAGVMPAVLLAAVATSIIFLEERRQLVLLGWLLVLVGYLPSSNLLPLVRIVADSYLYLSLAGFAVVCAAACERLFAAMSRWWVPWAVVALLIAVLLPCTLAASATYADGITLWSRVYSVYPSSPEACRNYGNAFAESDRPRRALEQYLECADKFGRRWVAKNIGLVLLRTGKVEQARQFLLEARRYHPDDPVIEGYLKSLDEPYR